MHNPYSSARTGSSTTAPCTPASGSPPACHPGPRPGIPPPKPHPGIPAFAGMTNCTIRTVRHVPDRRQRLLARPLGIPIGTSSRASTRDLATKGERDPGVRRDDAKHSPGRRNAQSAEFPRTGSSTTVPCAPVSGSPACMSSRAPARDLTTNAAPRSRRSPGRRGAFAGRRNAQSVPFLRTGSSTTAPRAPAPGSPCTSSRAPTRDLTTNAAPEIPAFAGMTNCTSGHHRPCFGDGRGRPHGTGPAGRLRASAGPGFAGVAG